ncbi:DUF2742 domain-containing protein [uncultured Gordonia sp.]|uniref:DUF2742 domain-containing protein n=1 Tax=uncultured Gordonia sp. TaxID=198437 RepID=UPI00258E62FF|nr:DUF2742 domain-containing protein [uncultured Gordonia sp.]
MITYTDALAIRARVMATPLPAEVDRADLLSLLTAGVRDALLTELDGLAERRVAKSAALVVSEAMPWGEVGRAVAARRAWLAANPWAKRVIA